MTPSTAARPSRDTTGGRAAASEPSATSAATGKIPYGAASWTSRLAASATAITGTGRVRRHSMAAPATGAATSAARPTQVSRPPGSSSTITLG